MISEFINRLDGGISSFDIRSAADLASAKSDQRRDTCFVILLDEAAAGNQSSGKPAVVRQKLTTGIGVIIALANFREKRGAGGISEIESAREQVRGALLGWQPPGADGPVVYRRGRLLQIANSTIWWQDEFEVPAQISNLN